MPHIIVKIAAGRTEREKTDLAEALANLAAEKLAIDPETISVAIEDVQRENWVDDVYKPEILARMDSIYKKPGYNPL
ncbi:tautomerase family protein [Acidocella facilis]|uniref:tautomerase family protein n=1 Tax=Acidocella facilis TaxID=525 RepID=UPI001F271E85|nr:tautomerase family protein [Acidocella facilis]